MKIKIVGYKSRDFVGNEYFEMFWPKGWLPLHKVPNYKEVGDYLEAFVEVPDIFVQRALEGRLRNGLGWAVPLPPAPPEKILEAVVVLWVQSGDILMKFLPQ